MKCLISRTVALCVYCTAVLAAVFFLFSGDLAKADSSDVKLSEVMWRGSSVSTADEWLELKNQSAGIIDISGWSPKYYPPVLVQYMDTLISNQVLFGTDYPTISPIRIMTEFNEISLKESTRAKVLSENAKRVLKSLGTSS